MRVLQLSDIHLRADGRLSFLKMNTMEAFHKSMDYFERLEQQPDMYVITGDLVENGNLVAYNILKETLGRLKRPVYIVPGNHDDRTHLIEIFGDMCPVEEDILPYICYTIDDYPVGIIVMETVDHGKHWGRLMPEVGEWLRKQLVKMQDKPVLVFTHHVPFKTGYPAMDEPFIDADIFAEILSTHNNLKLCCGHMHRSISTVWKGIPVITCPPISMLMDMDFSPEGGDAFYLGDPGYLVHDYHDGLLNSHIGIIPTGAPYTGPHRFIYLETDK